MQASTSDPSAPPTPVPAEEGTRFDFKSPVSSSDAVTEPSVVSADQADRVMEHAAPSLDDTFDSQPPSALDHRHVADVQTPSFSEAFHTVEQGFSSLCAAREATDAATDTARDRPASEAATAAATPTAIPKLAGGPATDASPPATSTNGYQARAGRPTSASPPSQGAREGWHVGPVEASEQPRSSASGDVLQPPAGEASLEEEPSAVVAPAASPADDVPAASVAEEPSAVLASATSVAADGAEAEESADEFFDAEGAID